MNGRAFTPEFKRECAELVLDHGYPSRGPVKKLTLERPPCVAGSGSLRLNEPEYIAFSQPPEQWYIRELEEQVKRLERDKEIIKKLRHPPWFNAPSRCPPGSLSWKVAFP